MLKKAIACLLVLAGVCSFHTSAADSKNEQFVNVMFLIKYIMEPLRRMLMPEKLFSLLPVNPLIFFR